MQCEYRELQNIAEEEGNFLKLVHGKLKECQDICDDTPDCKSLGYCSSDECYLFDKKIQANEPTKNRTDDCVTSYQDCQGGNCFFLFKKTEMMNVTFNIPNLHGTRLPF